MVKAAKGLQEASRIKSRALAALELFWQNGHAPIKRGDVRVIDEAGMIGTRQMARITAKCQEIGAKLVLVGDPERLQPIEADPPFRDPVDIHGAAKLTEIHRQKADWQKQATKDLAHVAMARHREELQPYTSHQDAPNWTRPLTPHGIMRRPGPGHRWAEFPRQATAAVQAERKECCRRAHSRRLRISLRALAARASPQM